MGSARVRPARGVELRLADGRAAVSAAWPDALPAQLACRPCTAAPRLVAATRRTSSSRALALSSRGSEDGGSLRIVSMGGATEAAVWSVTYEVRGGRVPTGWSSVPYGLGMRNQPVDVLDETSADGSLRRCDVWATGMIYIGGTGVPDSFTLRTTLSSDPRW